ncbi:MAG: ribosome-associated translation inhibitor RaiA [Candidatus Uhrbacteria bacterium]|nr:ribosome-associated translation inhibitor RaiA [Candidatus Uhrbacteria bacterium]
MRLAEIKATNMDLTGPIRDYVDEKLSNVAKLTEKFEPCDVRVEVGRTTMGQLKGDVFRCELNLTIPGVMLRSEVTKDDLYASIDVAVGELRRQVKDYKEKLRDADRVKMDTEIFEQDEEY